MKIFFTIVLFLTTSLSAQSFGKNKMQYRDFDWSYIQTPHFDIYYYGDQQSLAEFAAEVAELAEAVAELAALVACVDAVLAEVEAFDA